MPSSSKARNVPQNTGEETTAPKRSHHKKRWTAKQKAAHEARMARQAEGGGNAGGGNRYVQTGQNSLSYQMRQMISTARPLTNEQLQEQVGRVITPAANASTVRAIGIVPETDVLRELITVIDRSLQQQLSTARSTGAGGAR